MYTAIHSEHLLAHRVSCYDEVHNSFKILGYVHKNITQPLAVTSTGVGFCVREVVRITGT